MTVAPAQPRDDYLVLDSVCQYFDLGKTFLTAFDFLQMGGERALFVAHREEILSQVEFLAETR